MKQLNVFVQSKTQYSGCNQCTCYKESWLENRKSWVEGFSAVVVPGDDNRPWEIMGMEWNEIASPWRGAGGQVHREVRLLGLPTWTDNSSRTMAGWGVKARNGMEVRWKILSICRRSSMGKHKGAKEFNLRRTTGIYVTVGEQCSGAVVGIIAPSVCTKV